MAVYQKALKLLYVDQLLERMKAEFVIHYDPQVSFYGHMSCRACAGNQAQLREKT